MQLLSQERVQALIARESEQFLQRTARSRALLSDGIKHMPHGVPMSWMASLYRHAALFVDRGEGAYFWDVDGNRYLDMNVADYSATCGYAHPAVTKAVTEQAAKGTTFLLPTEEAITVSNLLANRCGLPHWQYTLSATQANIEALRLARMVTGRDQIVVFEGCYHGHLDEIMGASPHDGPKHGGYLGLHPEAGDRVTVIPFNDLEALAAALRTHQHACIIAEPALTNWGLVIPDAKYWEACTSLCRETGTLLIADETHTFAFAYGGLQRPWRLSPDILVLGKGFGSGVPLGVYGMTDKLAQSYSQRMDRETSHGLLAGGTMFANPLSLAGARAALQAILTPEGHERVETLARRLAEGLDGIFSHHKLNWRASYLGNRVNWCLDLKLPRNAREAEKSLNFDFIAARRLFMANRGVWDAVWSAGPAVSFAQNSNDINAYLDCAEDFVKAILGKS